MLLQDLPDNLLMDRIIVRCPSTVYKVNRKWRDRYYEHAKDKIDSLYSDLCIHRDYVQAWHLLELGKFPPQQFQSFEFSFWDCDEEYIEVILTKCGWYMFPGRQHCIHFSAGKFSNIPFDDKNGFLKTLDTRVDDIFVLAVWQMWPEKVEVTLCPLRPLPWCIC